MISVPTITANLIEPAFGILADLGWRRALILGGGVVFAAALLLTALSQGFALLMVAFLLLYPASGAFVSLSQAALMDTDPERREQNMARWTFAGSMGVVAGPLALSLASVLNLDWRELMVIMAGLSVLALLWTWRTPIPDARDQRSASADPQGAEPPLTFRAGVHSALKALQRHDVLRWLVLLQASDLMLDILYGFLALYFVDEVGVSAQSAALAVAVWTGFGLIGDFLLIPLVERVRGLVYLRISAALVLVLFPAFLLVPLLGIKLVIVGALGLLNAGWYAILKAQLYATMPGQSGTVLAVNNVSGLVGGLIPLGLGLVAEQIDLNAAMWLLIVSPVALLAGIPAQRSEANDG